MDLEKIGDLKDKVTEYSQITSDLIEKSEDDDGKEELLVFLSEKFNELKRNEINTQIFINNIDLVNSLCFGKNKTEVHFR